MIPPSQATHYEQSLGLDPSLLIPKPKLFCDASHLSYLLSARHLPKPMSHLRICHLEVDDTVGYWLTDDFFLVSSCPDSSKWLISNLPHSSQMLILAHHIQKMVLSLTSQRKIEIIWEHTGLLPANKSTDSQLPALCFNSKRILTLFNAGSWILGPSSSCLFRDIFDYFPCSSIFSHFFSKRCILSSFIYQPDFFI